MGVAAAAAGVAGSILLACTGQDYALSSSATTQGNDAAPGASDADALALDAEASANQTCSTSMPFKSVLPLGGGINTGNYELQATLTADETTIVFTRSENGKTAQLYMAHRASKDDDFGSPKMVDLSCAPAACTNASAQLSAMGDEMLFASDRKGGVAQIFHATRSGDGFANITLLFTDSDPTYDDYNPFLTNAGELFFTSQHSPTTENYIFRSLKTANGSFGPAEVFHGLAAPGGASDNAPVLSQDGLTMYFASTSPNPLNVNPYRIFVMERPTITSSFGASTLVNSLQVPGNVNEQPSWLSPDGCRLYFYSDQNQSGLFDIYVASKL